MAGPKSRKTNEFARAMAEDPNMGMNPTWRAKHRGEKMPPAPKRRKK